MRITGWADGTGKPDAHIRATCSAKSNTYFVHLTRVTWSFNIDFLVFVRNLVKDLAIQEAQIEIASKGLKLKDVHRNIVGGCSSQLNQRADVWRPSGRTLKLRGTRLPVVELANWRVSSHVSTCSRPKCPSCCVPECLLRCTGMPCAVLPNAM